jgi:hypothetical protein
MTKFETVKQLLRETGPEITLLKFLDRFGRRFPGGLANSIFYKARKSFREEQEEVQQVVDQVWEESETVEEPEPVAVTGPAHHTLPETTETTSVPLGSGDGFRVTWNQVFEAKEMGKEFLEFFGGDKQAAKEFLDRVL